MDLSRTWLRGDRRPSTDAPGKAVSNAYDTAGRLAAVTYPGLTNRFSYLKNGLLAGGTNATCRATLAHDGANRLSQATVTGLVSKGIAVNYAWDPAGIPTNVVTSLGVTNVMTFDAAERLASSRRNQFLRGDKLLRNRHSCHGRRKGFALLLRAAGVGDAAAQDRVGSCLFYGRGTRRNLKAAARWYRESALRGYPEGQYDFAICLLHGYGVAKQPLAAVKWFRKAMSQGHTPAMFCVAEAYYHGIGARQNYQKAFALLAEAARNGDCDAQCLLGVCLFNGQGCEPDRDLAKKWYLSAARRGHTRSQYNLACMYAEGADRRSQRRTLRWIECASRGGEPDAVALLRVLRR